MRIIGLYRHRNIHSGLMLLFLASLLITGNALGELQQNFGAEGGVTDPSTEGLVFYVAPDGSDHAVGTKESPFATLEKARDTIREQKATEAAKKGVTVFVQGGTYKLSQSFRLSAQDSGTVDTPVYYCKARGERPVFSGGIRLSNFTPVSDAAILERLPEAARDKVVQIDLAQYGVSNLKPLRLGGFSSGLGFKTHPVMELFFDGKAMQMSRWPNEGWAKVVDVSVKDGHKIHGREGSKTGQFSYEGDRPARWTNEEAAMLYGYWFFGWADSYERITSIDTKKKEILLEPPYCTYGYRAGMPYYAINLLSEIDLPGEWYLERSTGILYFYPPSDPAKAVVELSVADHPFVELNEVSHTILRGFVWELGGADAVVIRGGKSCTVANSTIRRCGGNGIVVSGGTSHTLLKCEIFSMGRGGMTIAGGDRKMLTPAFHLVENCEIHELSRIDHTYTPAIVMTGVGNRIRHNLLHDIPSSAIRLGGNDHLVELNEIHHVVQESDDQGGADMWGNATYRGNVYRYNYWHHIGNQKNPHDDPPCGQGGIRLDDAISGTKIYGNIFHRASAGKLGFGGVQIHGGKDNHIESNVFVECMAALSFSPWGESRWKSFVAEAMQAPEIDAELYLRRYPELKQLEDDHDVNYVSNNLVLNCEEFLRRNKKFVRLSENTELNLDGGKFKNEDGSLDLSAINGLMKQHKIDTIPVEYIGLY